MARHSLDTWQTAVQYHLFHTLAALIAVVAMETHGPQLSSHSVTSRQWRRATTAWILGIVLFSGSLYALALGGPRWLGPITPLGGAAFLVGWILIAFPGRSESTS